LRVPLIDETGAFLDAKPHSAGSHNDRSPLMHAIRTEGREL
jgi:hypothetical protein